MYLLYYICLMTRSPFSIKKGGNKSKVPLLTKRSVEVGDCSEYTKVHVPTYLTLGVGGTPPRTLYLLRVLYIPVCRDNAYYRVETKGEAGEESQADEKSN